MDTEIVADSEPITRVPTIDLLNRVAEIKRDLLHGRDEMTQLLDDHRALPPGMERDWFGRCIDVRGTALKSLAADLAATYDVLGWQNQAAELRAALDESEAA